MSEVLAHLQALKHFKSPSILEGINKIYFLEVVEKPGLVKIGDTHRLVETRNDETLTNASLHRSKPVTWVVAKKWNNSSFRDKSFHKFLEDNGYERELNDNGSKSEWFRIELDQALRELEKFIRKPVYKTVELRPAQHYLLDQLQQAIDAGHQYINAGFCVRVGKTIISLTLAARNNWMPVYIGKNLTSQSSAETDNAEYGIVPEMLTQSLHGIDELEAGDFSKRTKQIIQNIKKANSDNKPLIFFIDEVDDASHTKKSRDIITPVVEYFKEQDQFACIIPMSGTRIYRGEKILRELTDGSVKELSLEYYEMQILQPDTTCQRNFRHISFYSENADGLSNISEAMKNKDTGHKSLSTVITKLLGTNNFEFSTNENFPHWFIKIATVGKNNAKSLVKHLNRNHSNIENKQYHFQEINGDVTTAKDAQEFCKNVIKDNPTKICVFVSQGMATTSFSVSTIGNSVVFTDNELTADDTQALHRSATWTEGKKDCNMIVITTNDSMEYSFDDIFEDETKIAKTRGEKIEIYKELLNNNSMIHFTVDGKSVRPVKITEHNADKLIDKKMQSMTRIASIMTVINDLDEELLDKIVSTVTAKKPTSKRSGSSNAESFDPWGDNKNDAGNDDDDKVSSDTVSLKKKEQILRAFVENSVFVPAVAREQETTIQEFEYWDEIGISQELFFDVYNSSWMFKDRMDSIYNLCDNNEYLVNNYINKLAA